jgi:hypothetical protein
LLGAVLLVMVGESVHEMQQAGWIATTPVPGVHVPGWLGIWFSIFPNWETVGAQLLAGTMVIGSYLLAERRLHRRPSVEAESATVKSGDVLVDVGTMSTTDHRIRRAHGVNATPALSRRFVAARSR